MQRSLVILIIPIKFFGQSTLKGPAPVVVWSRCISYLQWNRNKKINKKFNLEW